jgi:hypothetical protein
MYILYLIVYTSAQLFRMSLVLVLRVTVANGFCIFTAAPDSRVAGVSTARSDAGVTALSITPLTVHITQEHTR